LTELKDFRKKHDFLVAIDSDGCAFDTMELKHKECFIPTTIRHWNLQAVSKYARAAAEFVNLYSKWRGINRWPALIKVFDLLQEWPEVQERGVKIPIARPLRDWIKRETRLSNPTLKAEMQRTGDPVLKRGLKWSEAVDAAVVEMVHGVPPFPLVRESLRKISRWADILVCSVTIGEELVREWGEHDLARYVTAIAGQEMGSKKEIIGSAGSKYDKDCVLMMGDAPGDREAACASGALFFPISPGQEEKSWERFCNEFADAPRYTREHESRLIEVFEGRLPELPPWKKKTSLN
jgi:phosphoglycolate phosphatase-like HAD superfamily hydrolase